MITREELDEYAKTNKKLAELAKEDFLEFWRMLVKADPTVTVEQALEYASYLIEVYGEASSLNAAEMFEKTNRTNNATLYGSVENEELERVVRFLVFNESEKALKAVLNMIGNQVNGYARETMIENAKENNIRFARVPVGKTCAFCLMLASRGYEYYSEESAGKGKLNAFHDNCDCQIVSTNDEIEGYDPDYLYEEIYLPSYEQAKAESSNELSTFFNIERKYGVHSKEAIEYAESIGLIYQQNKYGEWETVYRRRNRRNVNIYMPKDGSAPTRSYTVDDHLGRKTLAIIRDKYGFK